MAAINFKPQFLDAGRGGEKRQTIRQRGKRNPPKIGDRLTLYTGMRSAQCVKIKDVTCTRVEPITIEPERRAVRMARGYGDHKAWIDLDSEEIAALAMADGFTDVDAFFAFFLNHYGRTMSGYLIGW